MRILLLTPAAPYPPHQGGAMRNFGILDGLHRAGHTVDLLSFGEGEPPAPLVERVRRVKLVKPEARSARDRVRDWLSSPQPDLARRLHSAPFEDCLRAWLADGDYNGVQLEGLEMAGALPIIRKCAPRARVIYDAHNAEYALQREIAGVEGKHLSRLPGALYSRSQARRIAIYERDICAGVDAVIAVSDEDAALLRPFRAPGDRRTFVLPNGLFTDDYAAADGASALDLGANALVFTGKMDYRPNVDAALWFANEIFPLVRAHQPDACFYIVGQKPHRALDALRSAPGVEITGWVAQVQPYLRAAAVYVAPLRMGGGTRLKILEAMASGVPIVATAAAAAGLHVDARARMRIAADAPAFADAVIALLREGAGREHLGAAGRAVAREHYDWRVLIPDLLDFYAAIGLMEPRP